MIVIAFKVQVPEYEKPGIDTRAITYVINAPSDSSKRRLSATCRPWHKKHTRGSSPITQHKSIKSDMNIVSIRGTQEINEQSRISDGQKCS